MSILVDRNTRVVVQGITGKEGLFHTRRMVAYGTKVVAGVTPGKEGLRVNGNGIPVYDSVATAIEKEKANTSIIFVPARFAVDAIYEAANAGVNVIVCITEGIPALDMLKVCRRLALLEKKPVVIGPNCPGIITPGESLVGILPGHLFTPGNVGLVSRSGTLTYQIVDNLTRLGIGQSTCLGIGGDPVIGSNFIEVLEKFERDRETELVILIGEIGGTDEEEAAIYIKRNMSKPVIAFVAGITAPPGKRMGHAGAIISGSTGTAEAKIKAFEKAGVKVGRTPAEVAEIARAALK
jgi:succinyl-CoA synthetase alpha subunit